MKKSFYHFLIHSFTPSQVIALVSVFWVLTANLTFFRQVIQVYPLNKDNLIFLISLAGLFVCVNMMILLVLAIGRLYKPLLILLLLLTSMSAYFMDTYQVIIDDQMINNIFHTDMHETLDLLSLQQLAYFLFLGVFPSVWMYYQRIDQLSWKQALMQRLLWFGMSAAMALLIIFSQSGFYTSFFREHKVLRFYANPSYYLYSLGKYANSRFQSKTRQFTPIATDAKRITSKDAPRLVVFVVGETARAQNFSWNGYARPTNVFTRQQPVINFSHVTSCGTSTAYSVPCMFSDLGRGNFSIARAASRENILDILKRVGVHVLWRDNNSDSKGVADRVVYQSWKSHKNNPLCNPECRDVGMLSGLDEYIAQFPRKDILIVLHQMGNHGPAYYKRYPADFEQFTPVCQTNQLEQCSDTGIINAYDNALRYTDYFLSQVIQWLKTHDQNRLTAMIYVSDHGESLGEKGLYLHGLPYFMAPDEQTHVPMLFWSGNQFPLEKQWRQSAEQYQSAPLSHDNLFYSLLGLFAVKTALYQPGKDIFSHSVIARDQKK